MSEIAFAVDGARKASASISRIEQAIARDPTDRALHLNLSAASKIALKAQKQLMQCAELSQTDLCNYRLLPASTDSYGLASVSKSFLEYQNLFSQIYDALRNGIKQRAVIGEEARVESSLEFGYSYSGSLGIVLFAPSERGFFDGKFDRTIDELLETMSVSSVEDVRDIAARLGRAVVKRMHDWSDANVTGGFTADVRWNRSDGRQLGRVVERDQMANMLTILAKASDEKREPILVDGVLVGGDIMSGSFHFVVPGGESYKGTFSDMDALGEMVLDRHYRAVIEKTTIEMYATEKTIEKFALKSLTPVSV